jgi:hypothetical protein
VFSLGGWSPQIPTGFHVSRGTRVPVRSRSSFAYRTVTFFGEPFQTLRLNQRFVTPYEQAPQPRLSEDNRFGLFRVRSPLLTESRLISLPRGTEMVHFPRFASSTLCIQVVITGHDSGGVAPFRNPRIKACLPLPEAYRCLPRLSSPLCAKASTVNP